MKTLNIISILADMLRGKFTDTFYNEATLTTADKEAAYIFENYHDLDEDGNLCNGNGNEFDFNAWTQEYCTPEDAADAAHDAELARRERELDCRAEKGNSGMTIRELVEASGKSRMAIYNQSRKLGRLPTLEEIKAVKKGRPSKYK